MGLQPEKGTCDGRDGRYNHCSRTDVWIVCKSRGQCTTCSDAFKRARNKPKLIKKVSAKKLLFIADSNQYYIRAILANRKKNGGECRCDECGEKIKHPNGRNVSHIVSSGANNALYLDERNNKILCIFENGCEPKWTEGDRTTMKIWPECEKIAEQLTLEYYSAKSWKQK